MNPETLAGALENTWNRWSDRPALVYDAGSMTYAELGRATRRLAGAYRRLGVKCGDRIACSVSNRPENIFALGAAWLSGGIHVGVDYQSTAPELSAVVELTQARVLLYEPASDTADVWSALRSLSNTHPDLHIIVVGNYAVPEGYLTMSELLDSPEGLEITGDDAQASQPCPSPEDPALIFISSGTTGKPKATVGFHGNLAQRWQRLGAWLEFGQEDVHLVQMPLSHGFGLMMAVGALLTGGRLVLLRSFSARETLEVVQSERVTVFNGAPAHFKLVLDRHDPTRYDVSSLRLSVGTAGFFPPPLVRSIWEKLGVKFMFMYGSSEGIGVATTDREDILLGSVGRPAPGSAMIVGPDRQPLPLGEVGEIAFSRNTYPVRYWSDAGRESLSDASREAERNSGSASAGQPAPGGPDGSNGATGGTHNGWYYSGDLGRLDEAGRLYVFGRLKHQIDRGGLKVDPVEVESALSQCPGVADAAVIGLPNPVLGETVCACVALLPGYELSLDQVRAFLGGMLAPYKLPEELRTLAHIPRTRLGKVDLEKLRAEMTPAMQQVGSG